MPHWGQNCAVALAHCLQYWHCHDILPERKACTCLGSTEFEWWCRRARRAGSTSGEKGGITPDITLLKTVRALVRTLLCLRCCAVSCSLKATRLITRVVPASRRKKHAANTPNKHPLAPDKNHGQPGPQRQPGANASYKSRAEGYSPSQSVQGVPVGRLNCSNQKVDVPPDLGRTCGPPRQAVLRVHPGTTQGMAALRGPPKGKLHESCSQTPCFKGLGFRGLGV